MDAKSIFTFFKVSKVNINISLKEEEEEDDEEEEKDDGKDLQVLLDEANFQASGANIFHGSATDLNLSQK